MAISRQPGRGRGRKLTRSLLAAASLLTATAVVHASGWAPFTVNDSFAVVRGGSTSVLSTGATSLLANDFDLESDPLTAEIVAMPARGTITLNPDGTFLYTHNGAPQTDDRFSYRAWDGTGFSGATDVFVTVTGPGTTPQIIGQRYLSVVEEGSLAIAITDFVVNDPDSRFPQQFSFTLAPGSNYTLTGTTVTPAKDFNGTLTIPARVSDGETESAVFNLSVVVTAVNDAPVAGTPVADRELTEGDPVDIDAAAPFSDVDAGDRLTYTATGLPPSASLQLNAATGRLTGTPLPADVRAQPYNVTVTAIDTSGASAMSSFALRILPALVDAALTATVTPNPATADVAASWTLAIENRGVRSSPGGQLTARFLAAPAAVTLTAPARCAIAGNGTLEVTLDCAVEPIAPGASDRITVESRVAAPGDVAVLATLAVEDADPGNNAAAASLNLAGSFGKGPAQSLDGAAASVATGDLDGDGLADAVVAGGTARVYFALPDRTLEPGPTLGAAGATDVVALLDWNGDGLLDVAAASRGSAPGRIFLNDGARGFTEGPALPANVATALAADLDGDGIADLVLGGANGTRVVERSSTTRQLHAAPARHLASADLNADGRADLVITGAATRAVHVLTSTGSGFTFAQAALASAGSVASTALADYDGDGAPDLLLAIDGEDLGPPANAVLRNVPGVGFEPAATFGQSATLELHATDVNGDGINDVIAVNASGSHQVYFGNAQGGLDLQSELVLRPDTALGKVAPLDGDAFPDLLLAGPEQPSVGFYRNDGFGRFGPGDVNAPVITLVGPERVELKVGESFVDPGATASDDIEGDVSGRVQASGAVDTAVVGTYTVVYQVADRSGNSAAPVQRTIDVQAASGTSGGGGGMTGALALVALALATALRRRARPAGSGRAE